MNPNILTSLMGGRFRLGLEQLLPIVKAQIEQACQAMTVRPNMDQVLKTSEAAAQSLHAFTLVAQDAERLTCRPSAPHVVAFIRESTAALQELAGELVLCKVVTDAGNMRKRNPATEN